MRHLAVVRQHFLMSESNPKPHHLLHHIAGSRNTGPPNCERERVSAHSAILFAFATTRSHRMRRTQGIYKYLWGARSHSVFGAVRCLRFGADICRLRCAYIVRLTILASERVYVQNSRLDVHNAYWRIYRQCAVKHQTHKHRFNARFVFCDRWRRNFACDVFLFGFP